MISASQRDQLQATLAGHYEIRRELGAGGMATVLLAHDLKHDRDVAVKILHPELGVVLGGERFLEEIRTTARLQHPHILPLIDSGDAGGLLYYVMPFVEGESLRDRLTRERQLPIADAVRIAREAADALAYAHRHGVIHRDIKPENILLQHGHALVADFGIALAAARTGGERITQTGLSLGTPSYMSPEQATGERTLDARTDIYALGSVLYEMLVGEAPFTAPTAQAVIARVVSETAPRVRSRRPNVPSSIDDAVATALEKIPADRFRSAEDFEAALAATGGGARGGTTDAGAAEPTRTPAMRVAGVVALIALAAMGGLFALGLRLGADRGASPLAFGPTTHVTWDPALEITPALSPDGRMLAYASGQVPMLHIMVKPVAGGRAEALTGDTAEAESNPVWWPDGSRVLFLSRGGVYSAPAGGGPPHVEVAAVASAPVMSVTVAPDGTRIAFLRADTLFVRDSTGAPRYLATVGRGSLCSWSPRGTYIACMSQNPYYGMPDVIIGNVAPSAIVVVRVANGAHEAVTDSTSLHTSPVWSPDERWLYFVSNQDGPRDIYGFRMNGGHADGAPVRLTTGLEAHTIALAANGRALAYSRFNLRASIWSMPLPTDGKPAMTTNATRLTHANENIEAFDVSPDGAWLYYDSDLAGNFDIFRVRVAGGEAEQLTTDTADHYAPAVSPDGKEIAFHAFRAGNRDIWIMHADGSGLERVTDSPLQEALAAWSPNGQSLSFTNLDTRGTGTYVAHRDASGKWTTTLRGDLGGGYTQWSPDGSAVAATVGTTRGSVAVYPMPSGPSRLVIDTSVTPQFAAGDLSWAAPHALYFETQDGRGNTVLWAIDPTDAKSTPREVLRFDPRLHPANRGAFRIRNGTFYFLGQERASDVWVMRVVTR